jgi:hypothetical protein
VLLLDLLQLFVSRDLLGLAVGDVDVPLDDHQLPFQVVCEHPVLLGAGFPRFADWLREDLELLQLQEQAEEFD